MVLKGFLWACVLIVSIILIIFFFPSEKKDRKKKEQKKKDSVFFLVSLHIDYFTLGGEREKNKSKTQEYRQKDWCG